jgi:phosphomannomutase
VRQLKIGTSWVRGVVGEALNPELIVNFACAFGTWCDGDTVVIGRDTRKSSAMLHAAVVSGLLSTGCEVVDLGVSPSPVISFGVRELAAAGGISVSGSHNDVRWNALKFIGPDGVLLNSVKSEELLDIYHASSFLTADWRTLKPITRDPEIVDRYLETLLSALDTEKIRAAKFRVALDLCNGACDPVATKFMEALGCKLYKLNDEPSGEFAHSPAPSTDNMRQLASLMRYIDADLGAAVNVDGDRVGFVTKSGTALSEEYALPLAAQMRLARRPGLIITNLSTSRMVERVAEVSGQPVQRTMVGEGYVMDLGLAEGAVLVGEGSGGVAMLPVTMTYDALLAIGMVLESMAVSGKSLDELAAAIPKMSMRKGEIACPPDLVYRAIEGFRVRFADRNPDTTDGIRVDWPDAWMHVRASNTEPLLRVIVEADSPERTDEVFNDAMSYARRLAFGHGQG